MLLVSMSKYSTSRNLFAPGYCQLTANYRKKTQYAAAVSGEVTIHVIILWGPYPILFAHCYFK